MGIIEYFGSECEAFAVAWTRRESARVYPTQYIYLSPARGLWALTERSGFVPQGVPLTIVQPTRV